MQKPIKPEKNFIVCEEYIFDSGIPLKDILKRFSETARADFENIEIYSVYEYMIEAKYTIKQSIEEFNEQMESYKKELKKYNEWYETNKDSIKRERSKNRLLLKQKQLQRELEEVTEKINGN